MDAARQAEHPSLLPTILSWCEWPAAGSTAGMPAWGGARAERTEIENFALISLPIGKIKLAINPLRSFTSSAPTELTQAELHRLYANTSVPRHRYLAPALAAAAASAELAPHPAKWIPGISEDDLPSVVDAWLKTNGNTDYEQLHCIGLEPKSARLTAVFALKEGRGYLGGPSTTGSREYVAFWADWGSGFQYEGTTSVAVHDFRCLPPAGLEYSVSLPIDLRSRLRQCGAEAKTAPNTVKVRAVLSWNTPPSTTDRKAPVVWGDSMESRIPLPSAREICAEAQPSDAAAGESEMVRMGGGWIVNEAIHALNSNALGPYAGLTVALDNASAGATARDRNFTIHTTDIDGRGCAFTFYVWNRGNANPSARFDFKRATGKTCPRVAGLQD
jgi:hypothetical protein